MKPSQNCGQHSFVYLVSHFLSQAYNMAFFANCFCFNIVRTSISVLLIWTGLSRRYITKRVVYLHFKSGQSNKHITIFCK